MVGLEPRVVPVGYSVLLEENLAGLRVAAGRYGEPMGLEIESFRFHLCYAPVTWLWAHVPTSRTEMVIPSHLRRFLAGLYNGPVWVEVLTGC